MLEAVEEIRAHNIMVLNARETAQMLAHIQRIHVLDREIDAWLAQAITECEPVDARRSDNLLAVRKALDAYRHVRDELLEAAQSGRLEHALERGTPLVRQAYHVVKEACAALAA